ncbi:MAG: NAD-dependent epimerase/dehydratase family protein [Candidatus Hodarchaeota archaeon]
MIDGEFWESKKVLITGGTGFLGSNIVKRLKTSKCELLLPRSKEYDLRYLDQAQQLIDNSSPDIIIHCAAKYGGIHVNKNNPAKIFVDNLLMNTNIFEASREKQDCKFIGIGSSCGYPGHIEDYMKEDQFYNGAPHESVFTYGYVKRMLAVQAWAFEKEYNFNSIHLILPNMYGPFDGFSHERSHAVAALIRRFVEISDVNSNEIVVWGDGSPIREFLFVEDAVDAILVAASKLEGSSPLNIGTGKGTTIKRLVETISEIVQFKGNIIWDTTKPNGQPMKVMNNNRMIDLLGWRPQTSLREGLQKTIDWYKTNKNFADRR